MSNLKMDLKDKELTLHFYHTHGEYWDIELKESRNGYCAVYRLGFLEVCTKGPQSGMFQLCLNDNSNFFEDKAKLRKGIRQAFIRKVIAEYADDYLTRWQESRKSS